MIDGATALLPGSTVRVGLSDRYLVVERVDGDRVVVRDHSVAGMPRRSTEAAAGLVFVAGPTPYETLIAQLDVLAERDARVRQDLSGVSGSRWETRKAARWEPWLGMPGLERMLADALSRASKEAA